MYLNASMVHHVLGPAYRENLSALCSSTLWICFHWPVSAPQHQDEGATGSKPREVRVGGCLPDYFVLLLVYVYCMKWLPQWEFNSPNNMMLKTSAENPSPLFSPLLHSHDDIQNCVIYLCATMWHETYDEMLKILTSMFRFDTLSMQTPRCTSIT